MVCENHQEESENFSTEKLKDLVEKKRWVNGLSGVEKIFYKVDGKNIKFSLICSRYAAGKLKLIERDLKIILPE